jgi:hypothetical protein
MHASKIHYCSFLGKFLGTKQALGFALGQCLVLSNFKKNLELGQFFKE